MNKQIRTTITITKDNMHMPHIAPFFRRGYVVTDFVLHEGDKLELTDIVNDNTAFKIPSVELKLTSKAFTDHPEYLHLRLESSIPYYVPIKEFQEFLKNNVDSIDISYFVK